MLYMYKQMNALDFRTRALKAQYLRNTKQQICHSDKDTTYLLKYVTQHK